VGLLIEGEAGIGKTTLWKRGVAAATDRSYRVLSCRPVQAEAKLSFAALGDLFGEIAPDIVSGLPDPQRRALEIALLRAGPEGCPADRRAVSVAAVAVLRRLAQVGPLVLAVDDVQWLDGPSSRVLEFAIRRLHEVPVAVLVSFRTEGQVVPLGLDAVLPEGNLYRLPVGPLNLGALQHLIRTRINASLSRPVLLRVHAATGGNPLFALEMARMLQQRGAGYEPGQALPVPDNLRQLVRLRVARLPSRARNVLLAVSALARPTVDLVAEISTAPGRVTGDLERAVRAGVISLEAGRIVFTHPLLGSAIYADAPEGVRRSLHRRLAQLAAEPEERARHLALGADGPDSGVAEALEKAGHMARSRGAPDAAAELFELAAKLTPMAAARHGWRRNVDAACCYYEVGDTAQARGLLQQVVSVSPSGPDHARALLRLATVMHECDGPPRSVPLLKQALPQVGGDLVLRMELEGELAHELGEMGHLPAARSHARAAVELAERLGDRAAIASARASEIIQDATIQGITPGVLERAKSLAESGTGSVADNGQLTVLESPRHTFALLLMVVGELDRARGMFLEQDRRAVERGADYLREYMLWCLARVEYRAGKFEQAARYAKESHSAAFHQEAMQQDFLYSAAEAAAAMGDVDYARAAAGQGLAVAEGLGVPFSAVRNRSVLGFVELSVGNLAGAHHYLAPAVKATQEAGLGEPAYIQFLPDEIEALVGLGELGEAEALLASFEKRGEALDRAWALATAARCRGMLQAAQGDLPTAVRSVQRALKEHERVPQPFDLGRTLLVLGTIQRRGRKWGAARASLQSAFEFFEDLGAPLWAEKARAELRRIGGRPTSSAGLTATEEKVAELVASGLTNREVAGALFMSVNTVGANLSRIYHKLGVRSRTQLGAKLDSRRSTAAP
jgi:DNA-binding CsgD family transcriptional regulator